jgi:hypothetical protein
LPHRSLTPMGALFNVHTLKKYRTLFRANLGFLLLSTGRAQH